MTTQNAIETVSAARCPEDIFGPSVDGVKASFRSMALLLHPDTNPGNKPAEDAFKKLNDYHAIASARIADGTYGDKKPVAKPLIIKTKTTLYEVRQKLFSGDLTELYETISDTGETVLMKVPRDPRNNDLIEAEAKMVHQISRVSDVKDKKIATHIGDVIESFDLQQGKIKKRVNVLPLYSGFVTLAKVMEAFPDGLDLRDAAWMFNRLLAALAACKQAGVVHGAVTPEHFMIEPSTHNGILIDWCYATEIGQKMKAVVPQWKAIYPPEIGGKTASSFGVDIYMAAQVLLLLVGGMKNIAQYRSLQGLMRACALGPAHRTADAWELFGDFRNVLQDTFGKPKFREFKMPETTTTK